MAASNYKPVMSEVFSHEGGYVNHKADPGGETNYGISKRSYPDEDIRGMTRARAEAIYRKHFWAAIRGDELPVGVDLAVMDPAVNSGVSRGVRWMQQAAAMSAKQTDGVMGPETLRVIHKKDPVTLIQVACAKRMGFLRGLKTWATFGKGWSKRVASVEAVAVRMALEATNRPLAPTLASEADYAEYQANRNRDAALTSTVSGGGGTTFLDLPEWGVIALVALVIVLILHFNGRSGIEKERAEAYRDQLRKVNQ